MSKDKLHKALNKYTCIAALVLIFFGLKISYVQAETSSAPYNFVQKACGESSNIAYEKAKLLLLRDIAEFCIGLRVRSNSKVTKGSLSSDIIETHIKGLLEQKEISFSTIESWENTEKHCLKLKATIDNIDDFIQKGCQNDY